MSPTSVSDLIRRGAEAPPHLSAVDAVMGEDWAHIKLGDPKQLLRMDYLVRREADRTARRKVSISAEIVQRRPQAMVKLVRKGGASDAAGLRAQMDYLSREGAIPLSRSERYFGAELDAGGREDLVAGWGFDDVAKGKTDRTSHFVVSFPAGTSTVAAEQAGRAWAEEMFASGRFGDSWDYYTAFHTDRAHPHIHVVVNRRGLETGEWLKVSKRSPITFDTLREVQVEVAARHGIDLVATPRLARGVHDRPASDAAYRRTERAGKALEGPAHTPVTAVQAAAAVLFYARRFQADADLVERDHHPVAMRLRAAAASLREGLQLDGAGGQGRGVDDPKEVKAVSELIEGKRAEVVAGFADIDREIAGVDDAAQRARLQRSAAELKAQAAALLPDREDLQAYREPASGRYAGIVAIDAYGQEVKDRADDAVRRLAQEWGVNAEATVARYGGAAMPPVVAGEWEREEIAALEEARRLGRLGVPDDAELSGLTVADFHARIDGIYRNAAERMLAHEEGKEELRSLSPVDISGDPRRFARLVRNTLTERQRQRLEKGLIDALGDITDDRAEQVRLAHGYLSTMKVEATSVAEREQVEQAQRAVDRASEEIDKDRRRDRNVDRDDGYSL